MAGRGPAPKSPSQRTRRNEPARGDWITLPAELEKSVLPALPKRLKDQGGWSNQTSRAWKAWRADPATSQFGPAEIQVALDTIYLYEQFARGKYQLAAEIRLRLDGLGLTLKGKRDLRLRLPDLADVTSIETAREKSATQRRQEMRDRALTAEGSS